MMNVLKVFCLVPLLLVVVLHVQAFVPSSIRQHKKKATYAFHRHDDASHKHEHHHTLFAVVGDVDRCDVAIFGGGFGGLYTALALARESRSSGRPLDIVLVDPSDNFVFLPLLYDLTVGTATEAEVCPKFSDLLEGTGVRHIRSKFDCFSTPDLYVANVTSNDDDDDGSTSRVAFRAAVVAVGATPKSILESVPGAANYTQPFYTQENAQETQEVLKKIEQRIEEDKKERNEGLRNSPPRIAIIGGGYGGVELAACVKRRIPGAGVSLLTRGPPMKGTRAEPLVQKALDRLDIVVEQCTVNSIEPVNETSDQSEDNNQQRVIIKRQRDVTETGSDTTPGDVNEPWDLVLWTAGSTPAYPVSNELKGLSTVSSGRLASDETLQCIWDRDVIERTTSNRKPPIWAIGDCAEIVDNTGRHKTPRTAQAAMQQSEIVANNILAQYETRRTIKTFQYQDLGSMMLLGGPNAAAFAPREDSPLAPLFTPLIDTARVGLGIADTVLTQLSKTEAAERVGLTPIVDNLGLSLGGYGLGVDASIAPGTVAGTLTGAARRVVYAARMPTNRQRAYAAASAAISTAASLAREASKKK